MSGVKIVKQKLRQLLQTVDFNVETQRSITAKLESDLGFNLSQYKPLIKEEIDAFLTEQQDVAGDDDSGSDFQPEEEEAPPPAKKQKAAAGAAQGSGGAAAPASPAGEFVMQLSKLRFAVVRRYGGKLMVDVREYYDKEGKLQPGRKGVALQTASWGALEQQLGAVSQALQGRDESFTLDLGSAKRATISTFKGRCNVDLREYYEKEGEMLPGKKGIALSEDEWSKLCAAAVRISQQLASAGGGAGPSGSGGGTGGAAQAQCTAAGPNVGAVPSGAGAAAGASAAADAGAGAGGGSGTGGGVDLSGTRRADVSEFKGKVYVNIREYYEKDGQKLPGKKGISLPPDQFATLRQGAAELDAALRERNTEFEVQLSGKRKASISCFKGRYMVNIREYYEKGGELLPGQKGISLPEEQWARLMVGLTGLQAALEQQAT